MRVFFLALAKYLRRVALAFDLCMNVVTGGNFDETISSRVQRVSDLHHSWRAIYKTPFILLAKIIVGFLNLLQKHHGIFAEANDLIRAEYIAAVLKTAQGAPQPTQSK